MRRSRVGSWSLTREEACERFAGSPPGLIPGIGPKTAARLTALGITTLGQLAAATDETLAAGSAATTGATCSAGRGSRDSDAVVPVREAVSESRETTFDADLADRAEMEAMLRELAAQLCERLAKREVRGRTIGDQGAPRRLHDRHAGPHARRRRRTTPRVVQDVALALLRGYAPAAPRAAARGARGGVRARRAGARGPEPAARAGDLSAGGASSGRRLVQRRGQPPPRVPRERVLDAELSSTATTTRRRSSLRPSAAGIASIRRSNARSWSPASSAREAPPIGRVAERARGSMPRGQARRPAKSGERCRRARSASSRRRGAAAASRARPRRRRVPAPARARGAATPRRPRRRARRPRTGRARVEEPSTCAGGCAPTNSSTTWPSLNALTAGMPWIRNACAIAGLASVSSLASTTLPSRALRPLLQHRRPSCAARAAPLGPEVDDDRHGRASAR